LFNPPVTGSHASVCKINTVLNGLASLKPTLDLSEPEPRAISEPDGYRNRIWGRSGALFIGEEVEYLVV
jgi:hypothetical protein